MNDLRKI